MSDGLNENKVIDRYRVHLYTVHPEVSMVIGASKYRKIVAIFLP